MQILPESRKNGNISISFYEANVNLIPKPGKTQKSQVFNLRNIGIKFLQKSLQIEFSNV